MGDAEVFMNQQIKPDQDFPIKTVSALSLSVVVVLYLAHALPLYFYNVALPAILRHQG
jgi:hypothetical protein